MNILLYMIYYNMCAIPMHKSAGIYRKKASPFRIYSAPARLGKVTSPVRDFFVPRHNGGPIERLP